MSGLKERARRFWVSTLFLLLGPSTLFLACLALFWQKTPVASRILNERLSSQTRVGLQFGSYSRVRPNVELLARVSVLNKKTNRASFFCPEVYRVRQADSSIFASFARSFDERTRRVENESEKDVGAEFDENQRLETDEQSDDSKEDSFRSYFDEANAFADNFELYVVPRVYCRDSQLDKLQNEIDALTSAFSDKENRAICLVVQEIICQSDDEFEASSQACDVNEKPLRNSELRSIFRAAALMKPQGEADISGKSIRREVLAFASEYPTLENFRALFVQTENYSRIETLFELQKLARPRPYYYSQTRQNDGTSYVEYDSRDVPTPVSFVAKFLPSLRRLGDECYFFGKIRSSTDRNFQEERFSSALNVVSESSPNVGVDSRVWTTNFEAFRLCNLQIDELCAKFALPNFTGRLTKLTIDQGAIRQGVFLGSGSVAFKECSVPTKVLEGLRAKKLLEIFPREAASLRFANDATPFHDFEVSFKLLPSGVVLDSAYSNKIIACYQRDELKYGAFLSKAKAGETIPYSDPISALVESQNVKTFWTPLVRDALNHLPISDATPRTADAADSILR